MQAAISFAFLFVLIRSLGTVYVSLCFLAGSRHHCITAAPGGTGQGWNTPLPAPPPQQLPDIHNKTKISPVLHWQVFLTSVAVKSSKLISLNPTLVFAKKMQNAGWGTDCTESHILETACNPRDLGDAAHSTKRKK